MSNRSLTIQSAKEHIKNSFNIGLVQESPYAHIRENIGNVYESSAPEEIKDALKEINCVYKGYCVGNKTILVRDDLDRRYLVMPTENTAYSSSISEKKGQMIKPGDRLNIIALSTEEDNLYLAVTIIREDEKELFNEIKGIYGKALAIRAFYTLFKDKDGQKNYIISQLKGRKYPRYTYSQDIRFDTRQEFLLRYAMCKENFPYETQRAFEGWLMDKYPTKHKVDQKIFYLSRISPVYKDRTPVEKEGLEKFLNGKFYKMDKAKSQIIETLVSNERAKKRAFNIMLVGGPGVGKTALLTSLAEYINIPSEVISMNGMSTTTELEGLDAGYESANAGRIVRAFAGNGTSEMLLVFDELDKTNVHSKEGNPLTVLYQLLLGKHEDKLLGCPISTENTMICATCNSTDGLPQALLDRFDVVIHMDDYTIHDKVEIAKRHIIPDILEMFNLSPEDISFEDEAIKHISSMFCDDGGARGIKSNIEIIVRHLIKEDMTKGQKVDAILAEEILFDHVRVTPAIFLNRNSNEYSKEVLDECRNILEEMKMPSSSDVSIDGSGIGKERRRLEYLLSCRTKRGDFCRKFNAVYFEKELKKGLYGMENVIKELLLIYHDASINGNLNGSNVALVGGMGVGKTTIASNIAKSLGYGFEKISLNGIDDIRELRGFSITYASSRPGRIIEAVKRAKGLRNVFLLDEIDKVKPECANALIDLLDREFTDDYIDVPVRFDGAIFIATANDWSNVPAVIRDRFSVIKVEGYTRRQKGEILKECIIPELEEYYKIKKDGIELKDDTMEYLLKTYCNSFGVRDVKRAMKKIVGSILLEDTSGEMHRNLVITKENIDMFMGQKPMERGNFPAVGKPGVTKALAVSGGIYSNSFAIETMLMDGNEEIEITGLPRESAVESVKIAASCVKNLYPELLNGKRIHVHFGEGSVPKDGPSAGTAIFMSIYSAATGKLIMDKTPYDVAFTGELSLSGGIFAVGGVREKIQAAADSGCTTVYIPEQNYKRLSKEDLENFECKVVSVSEISQLIKHL